MFGIVPVRVLIVDDERAICSAVKTYLERSGYEACAAHTCDSAMAILRSERVDVLILDLRVQEARGDVIYELAKSEQPHLVRRTLFVTGDISEQAERLIEQCNCPVLRKPFELKDILNIVITMAPRPQDLFGNLTA